MSESNLHLREPQASSRRKRQPQSNKIFVPFFYAPSDDGTDENLLILLHGLGDTHVPFSKLGTSLNLPQTAVLALRAPDQVPFLYEESYQWYNSFDNFGELLERPNPTPALELLTAVVDHLLEDCAWPSNRIHLFGFAQGGTVASEFGVHFWKRWKDSDADGTLGSIVTVSGPLISYPTLSTPSPTPVLVVHRTSPPDAVLPAGSLTAFKKGFGKVLQVKLGSGKAGMPSSKDEWEPIMTFWSQNLGRRQVEGLYEVMSGQS